MYQGAVIGIQILANIWVNTARLATGRLDLRALAADPVHICSRPTKIGNNARKAGHLIADIFNLSNNGVFTATLNDTAFVLGNRTEGATTKTTTHDIDAKPNHFPRGDLRCTIVTAILISIDRMGASRVRQIEDQVHLSGREWNRWGIDPNIPCGSPFAVGLNNRPGVPWVSLKVQNAVCVRIQNRV